MKETQNLIIDSNDILEGLNFLVPSLWWKNFLSENSHIRNIKSIRIRQSNPIESLFQLGIIQKQPSNLQSSFNETVKEAQCAAIKIKKQLKQAEKAGNEETSVKRNRLPFQWLEETNDFQASKCDLLLYSPQVSQNMVELFEIGEQYWVVVSPQLYRLIWLNSIENEQKSKRLTAIPIILKRSQIQNFDKRITFQGKRNLEIFFNNISGYSFVFRGSIDKDLQIQELVRYLDDGMFRLIGGCKHQKNLQESNKLLHIPNYHQEFFYDLQDDKAADLLPWTDFKQIKYSTLRTGNVNKIHVFLASYNSNNLNVDNQCTILPISSRTRKKMKGDFTVCQSESVERRRAGTRDINIGEINHRIDFAAEMNNDVHHSTQQQTPLEQRSQRNVIILQNTKPASSNRIAYSIWRQGHEVENLIRYAQVRIAIPKIHIPHKDQRVLVFKEEAKKTVLPRGCNQLIRNEEGELMQKQISQNQAELTEQPPNQSTKKQLQLLALQIQGIKINEMVQQAQKVRQLVKQKEQPSSNPSKNVLLDEFDFQQSRQN